jgi:hypothetical protein
MGGAHLYGFSEADFAKADKAAAAWEARTSGGAGGAPGKRRGVAVGG